jgi:hypothetical protein
MPKKPKAEPSAKALSLKKVTKPPLVETGTALITQKNAASIAQQTKTLKQQVESVSVTSEVECQSARVLLTRIITARDKASAFIRPILENAKEGLRLAKEQETQLVQPLEQLRVSLKTTINAYLTEVMRQERAQREEQEKKKAEYEERIARSKRPERIKEPEPIPEEEIITKPVLENTVIPMVPKYEISNEALIPEKFWKRVLDRELLWAQIREAHKNHEALVIPGVRIWEEASLTIRR